MKRACWLALGLLLLMGCAKTPRGYWPVLPSPVTQKAKPQKICITMQGKEAKKYAFWVSLYHSNHAFVCSHPNLTYAIKKYIRSELSDFNEVFFLEQGEKGLKDCYKVALSWKNWYKGKVKGGMGFLGKAYYLGGKIECTLKGAKGEYDCSVVGWDIVPESDFNGPETYVCKDNPAEVFFTKLASKLAYKMALRVRKAILEDLGYPVSADLAQADTKMTQELRQW